MHGGNVPSTSYIWFKILFSMFSYSSTSMVFECHSHSLSSDIEIHWLNQFLFHLLYSNKWWKKCSSISFSRHLYLISIICKYWQLENFHKFRIWVKTRNSKPGEEPRLGSVTSGGRVGGPLGLIQTLRRIQNCIEPQITVAHGWVRRLDMKKHFQPWKWL